MLAIVLAALLAPGAHGAGYRSETVRDATRAGRTVFVQAWYPAAPAAGASPMPYGEYLNIDPALRARSLAIHAYALKKYGAPSTATEQLLASKSGAFRDAAPAPGVFPLIAYAGGAENATDESALLGEWLASHGFVFVAIPATGHSTLAVTLDGAGLETQARDLELAASWAARQFRVEPRWIAGGFSFGGAAAIAVANRQPDVRAVFMLDSSATSTRYSSLVAAAPFFDPERLTVPVLDLHRAENVSYDVFDRFRYAERFSFDLEWPNHIDFTAFPLLYAPDSDRARGYAWLASTVLAFAKGSRAFPATDVYRVTSRHRQAIAAPPSASQLAELARRDPAEATRVYEALRVRDPNASVLAPESINRIGYALLNDHPAAAREVFLWNVRAHPRNAGWLDSLGDALLRTNERDCARAVFARVVALTDSGSLRERAQRELAALPGPVPSCKYFERTETP